jgi:hypothetical protein
MAAQARSVDELIKRILVEPGALDRIKADPARELQRLAVEAIRDTPPSAPLESDVWVYRIVVGTIGAVALLSVAGAVLLANRVGADKVPDVLTAIGSAAIGALAGLLTPIPFRR